MVGRGIGGDCFQSAVAKPFGDGRRTRRTERGKLVEDGPLDFAESALFQQIAKGDTKAITFYLENKGASRGYSKRQSIDVNADVKVSGKPNVIMDNMEETDD